jgi:hypothetical protein
MLAVRGALAEIYIDKLRKETNLWNGSIPFGYCNGLCATCIDVNGKDYYPNFGQANRSQNGIFIAHPIESIAMRLTYGWYETGSLSRRLIADQLNAYRLVLPDGSTRRFRTKRSYAQGGPQPIPRSAVREILARIFYTGHLP